MNKFSILEQINNIFYEANTKKDYYYIFVKKGIGEFIWSHHIKTKIPLQKKTLRNSVIYENQYALIYMVETKYNTTDILNVKSYIISLDEINNGKKQKITHIIRKNKNIYNKGIDI